MAWNYRVIRHVENLPKTNEKISFLEIHEVYYSENGNPNAVTKNPVSVGADDIDELKEVLEMMKLAIDKPIIDMQYFTDLEKEKDS